MSRRFVVGTRGSALARWQTDHVNQRLREASTAPDVEVRVITTQGDVNLAERLAGTLEKGFFTAELEAALHAGEIDWAVHSLKDLPTRMPAGLTLVAVLGPLLVTAMVKVTVEPTCAVGLLTDFTKLRSATALGVTVASSSSFSYGAPFWLFGVEFGSG